MDISRRQFIGGALVAGASALLAGCSSSQVGPTGGASEGGSAAQPKTAYPLTLSMFDATGAKVEQVFQKAPERVVTLNDSTCEIMLRLGLGEKVVGTVAPDGPMPEDLQEAYSRIAQIGDKKTLSRESVVGLSPDAILGRALYFTEERQLDAKTINDMGINCYIQLSSTDYGEPSLQGVIDDVRNIARIFDAEESAAPYLAELEGRLQALRSEAVGDAERKPSCIFMTNLKSDGTFGLFGVAKGSSLQSNLIEDLGGSMATTQSASGLTFENLLAFNPDVIVYVTAERNKEADSQVESVLAEAQAVQSVPAVANRNLVKVSYSEFMDYTPRLFDSAEKILPAINAARG